MSDYTPSGNPANLSRGVSALIRAEFVLIQTAVNSKMDETGGTFSGPIIFSNTVTLNGAATFNAAATFSGAAVSMSGATSVTVPTVASTDSSTNAASTAMVQAVAFNAALPAQTGNAGKFVTTDGTNASWAEVNTDPINSPTFWMFR